MNLDYALFHFLNQFAGHNAFVDALILLFAHYSAFILIFVFIGYTAFSRLSKKHSLEMAWAAFSAAVVGRLILLPFIHLLIHRPRPYLSYDIYHLLFVPSFSFPSGHATIFFALSTVAYLHNKQLGKLFFIITTVMVLARIAAGVHYPSDIVAGAILGMFSAYVIDKSLTYHHHRKHARKALQ